IVEAHRLMRGAAPRELTQTRRHDRPHEQIAGHRRDDEEQVCARDPEQHPAHRDDKHPVGEARPAEMPEIVPAACEPDDRLERRHAADLDVRNGTLAEGDRGRHVLTPQRFAWLGRRTPVEPALAVRAAPGPYYSPPPEEGTWRASCLECGPLTARRSRRRRSSGCSGSRGTAARRITPSAATSTITMRSSRFARTRTWRRSARSPSARGALPPASTPLRGWRTPSRRPRPMRR